MWFRASSHSARISYPPISIDSVELTVTKKQKCLALIFDYSLSWTHHVASVCSKMSYYLYLLSSYRHVIDYNLMIEDAFGIPGVISFVLMYNSLGSITWK